ncbi:MAG: ABC transporter ATP-binding protein [Thermoplasmatales archaeon]|jgi:multidrug/hemolysin transport system ATP-binding protein|nr:ABC transporter ATP-binding protein [Thermoplasmatales archaeon]
MIEVSGLSKAFGDVEAVSNINFSVKKGQLFAFLGPNGAGKSTTINILCTLLKPDSGRTEINGRILGEEDAKIRESIGIVFQNGVLDPLLTVRENLLVRGSLYGLSRKECAEMADDAMAAMGITDLADRRYKVLSGGQKRKADIARALVNKPKLIFLDEPTTGLDPNTRKHVWDLILNLKESGVTVFLTTHYMEEAEGADTVVVVNNGRIVAEGTPFQLMEEHSSDILTLVPKDPVAFDRVLRADSVIFSRRGERFIIPVGRTLDAADLIQRYREHLVSLEVRAGTLDDAFINITGGGIE